MASRGGEKNRGGDYRSEGGSKLALRQDGGGKGSYCCSWNMGGGGVSETQEVEAPDPGPGGHSGKRTTLSLVFAL